MQEKRQEANDVDSAGSAALVATSGRKETVAEGLVDSESRERNRASFSTMIRRYPKILPGEDQENSSKSFRSVHECKAAAGLPKSR